MGLPTQYCRCFHSPAWSLPREPNQTATVVRYCCSDFHRSSRDRNVVSQSPLFLSQLELLLGHGVVFQLFSLAHKSRKPTNWKYLDISWPDFMQMVRGLLAEGAESDRFWRFSISDILWWTKKEYSMNGNCRRLYACWWRKWWRIWIGVWIKEK